MKIEYEWTEFEQICIQNKTLSIQYKESKSYYHLIAVDGNLEYKCTIGKTVPVNDDQNVFEINYKALSNNYIIPLSEDGKPYSRAESRPLGCMTCFIGKADSETDIGDGQELSWDFSNDDNIVDTAPTGFKRKRIEFKFLDDVWLKGGKAYYFDTLKDSYADVYLICPTGQYYYDAQGNLVQATEDTPIGKFIIYHPIQGTVQMGNELKSETCSAMLPSNFKLWMEITVPNADVISNGHFSMELYRKRTLIL